MIICLPCHVRFIKNSHIQIFIEFAIGRVILNLNIESKLKIPDLENIAESFRGPIPKEDTILNIIFWEITENLIEKSDR